MAPDRWDPLIPRPCLVQLLSVKPVGKTDSTQPTHVTRKEQYRVLVSDGSHYIQALLDKRLNSLVESGEITKHVVVALNKASSLFYEGKRIIQLIEVRIIEHGSQTIGNPSKLPPNSSIATGIAREAEISLSSASSSSASPYSFISSFSETPSSSPDRHARPSGSQQSASRFRPVLAEPPSSFSSGPSPSPPRSTPSEYHTPEPGPTITPPRQSFPPVPSMITPTRSHHAVKSPSPIKQLQAKPFESPSRPSNAAAGSRKISPIASLNTYSANCTIKALVVQKSSITPWKSGRGSLFKFTLMDDSSEISCAVFESVQMIYDRIEEGKVYFFTGVQVKPANKQFASSSTHDFELVVGRNTTIDPCTDSDAPTLKYNFVSIAELKELRKDSYCDVIGIVKQIGQLAEFSAKESGRVYKKRFLLLVDKSLDSVQVTLWDAEAESFKAGDDAVLVLRRAKVSSFDKTVSLSVDKSTSMAIEPDIPEAHDLRRWYHATGATQSFPMQRMGSDSTITLDTNDLVSIKDIVDANLNEYDGKKHDFFTEGTIVSISRKFAYPACAKCSKKLAENGHGAWSCASCKSVVEHPNFRYLLTMEVADRTAQIRLQAFNEVGEKIFGMKADELIALMSGNDEADSALRNRPVSMAFSFLCRANEDDYKGQTRIRYTVEKLNSIDYKEASARLRNMLMSPWATS